MNKRHETQGLSTRFRSFHIDQYHLAQFSRGLICLVKRRVAVSRNTVATPSIFRLRQITVTCQLSDGAYGMLRPCDLFPSPRSTRRQSQCPFSTVTHCKKKKKKKKKKNPTKAIQFSAGSDLPVSHWENLATYSMRLTSSSHPSPCT